jgi:hypothetical protein
LFFELKIKKHEKINQIRALAYGSFRYITWMLYEQKDLPGTEGPDAP